MIVWPMLMYGCLHILFERLRKICEPSTSCVIMIGSFNLKWKNILLDEWYTSFIPLSLVHSVYYKRITWWWRCSMRWSRALPSSILSWTACCAVLGWFRSFPWNSVVNGTVVSACRPSCPLRMVSVLDIILFFFCVWILWCGREKESFLMTTECWSPPKKKKKSWLHENFQIRWRYGCAILSHRAGRRSLACAFDSSIAQGPCHHVANNFEVDVFLFSQKH